METSPSILMQLGVWNWLILAAILFVLEILAPGVFLIWFGIAAAIVGVIAMTMDISWQWQAVLFAGIALVMVLMARSFYARGGPKSDSPLLNRRAKQHIGRSYQLAEAIVNGRGKAHVGDSLWTVEGPDLEKGTNVLVTGSKGAILIVEPA